MEQTLVLVKPDGVKKNLIVSNTKACKLQL